MRKYIDLFESFDEDAEEEALSQSYDREKHVESLIRFAFDKVGLPINYNNYSVRYEDSTREAEVVIEDQAVSFDKLAALATTGLAEGTGLAAYRVEWSSDALVIAFRVADEMDHARIPSE